MIRRRDVLGLLIRVRRQADTIRGLEAERDAVRADRDQVVLDNRLLQYLHAEARWRLDQVRDSRGVAEWKEEVRRAYVHDLADECARLRREVEAHEATIVRLRPVLMRREP